MMDSFFAFSQISSHFHLLFQIAVYTLKVDECGLSLLQLKITPTVNLCQIKRFSASNAIMRNVCHSIAT